MAVKPGSFPPNKKPNRFNNYLRYSGLALQLLVTIAVCGWLGHLADRYVGNKYPIFMLLLGFLGFGGIMYQIYRSINRQS
jgi:F0F1-type ATP synthase assembly protein I